MEKEIKKVSVVIPNYNYAHYLHERINTVINQNYPIYELIILDDKSTDNSDEIIKNEIKKIKEKFKINVKYFPNEKNSGNVFKQWEKAFELSTGDYLWIAEADDICKENFLEEALKGFKEDDVIISYVESSGIDENGECFKEALRDWIDFFSTKHWEKDYIIDGKEELANYSIYNCTIANVSSVIFNKKIKIDYKGILKKSQEFTLAGDWYFYSKLLLNGKISYNTKSLNGYRMHQNSVSTNIDHISHYNEIIKMQKSILSDINVTNNVLKNIEVFRAEFQRKFEITEDMIKDDFAVKTEVVQNDLISVVMPNYNRENTIKESIESVLNQTYQNIEFIIVDDGSTDNSCKIIESIKDDRIKLYKLEKNVGICNASNIGVSKANGTYIARMDSDDIWYPKKLEKQISFLRNNQEYKICFSTVNLINEDGKDINEEEKWLYDTFMNRKGSREEYLHWFFFESNCLSNPSVLMETSLYREIGGYNLMYNQLHDFEYWIRVLKKYPIYVFKEKLLSMRRFQDKQKGVNNSAANEQTNICNKNETVYIIKDFFNDMTNDLFIRTFAEDFRCKDSKTDAELECEKCFVTLKLAEKRQEILVVAFEMFENVFNNEETYNLLINKYNFTTKNLYELFKENIYNDKNLNYLYEKVNDYEVLRSNYEESVRIKDIEINELKNKVCYYENSRSWKFMKPIRKIFQIKRNIFQRLKK